MDSKIFSIDGRGKFVDEIVKVYNSKFKEDITKEMIESPDRLIRGSVKVEQFSDNEIEVNFEETIRGLKVYLVCSTNTTKNLTKLFLAIDAAKKASAEEIIAVIPYYGYARQDRKAMRGSSGASLFARLLQESGVDRVVSIDLHAEQIQGFFKIPVDHIRGKYIFPWYIEEMKLENLTLCSPDAGGVKRVDAIMKKLQSKNSEINMVMLSKRRDKPNSIESMDLIGDVKGRNVIIIDDIVDTAGTLCKAASKLIEAGALSVRAICTHGVLSGKAIDNIGNSVLTELIISDTLPVPEQEWFGDDLPLVPKYDMYYEFEKKLKVVSTAHPIARLIQAINNKQSANILEEIEK